MISVDMPGANAPGLFTGTLGIDAAGRLAPGLATRGNDAIEAIDAAWKAPSLAIANCIAALLIEYGNPAARVTLIELNRARDEARKERG